MHTCFDCGREMKREILEFTDEVNNEKITFKTKGFICECGRKTIEAPQMEAYDIALADAYRKKNGLLTTDEIKGFRRRLGISQQVFADFLGVSVRSIKRWEHGCVQDRAMDNLMRLNLKEHFKKKDSFNSDWEQIMSKSKNKTKIVKSTDMKFHEKVDLQESQIVRLEESYYAFPMQLKDFRLIHLLIDANENYSADVTRQVEFETSYDYDVYKSTEGQTFKISLSIRIKPVRNRKYFSYKKIEIKLEGIFSFPPDTKDEIIEKLVPLNCLAILHGLARGIVSSVTGNTQGGKFLLPTMNFVEEINEKVKKQGD